MSVRDPVMVRKGEIFVAGGHSSYKLEGVGSCIALFAIDTATSIHGVLHAVLPSPSRDRKLDNPAWYVETGVSALLDEMQAAGALRSDIFFGIVGGSSPIKSAGTLDIGCRNLETTRKTLGSAVINILVEDTGGRSGRNITFDSNSGQILVRKTGGDESVVGCLRPQTARKAA